MTETPQQAAIEEFMAHNDAERHVYALQLGGTTHLVSTDETAAEQLRTAGIQIVRADNQTAMEPLLLDMHPQARGLGESGLARSFERLGRAAEVAALFSPLPIVVDDPSKIVTRPINFRPLTDIYCSYWDVAPPTMADLHPSTDPNAGKQAPPARREWWANNAYSGSATPGNGDPWNNPYRDSRGVKAHPEKKASRKAQKDARRRQR